jgi:hypothetical protein
VVPKLPMAVERLSGTRRDCCRASRTDRRRRTPASACRRRRRSGVCHRAGILHWSHHRSSRPVLHGNSGSHHPVSCCFCYPSRTCCGELAARHRRRRSCFLHCQNPSLRSSTFFSGSRSPCSPWCWRTSSPSSSRPSWRRCACVGVDRVVSPAGLHHLPHLL